VVVVVVGKELYIGCDENKQSRYKQSWENGEIKRAWQDRNGVLLGRSDRAIYWTKIVVCTGNKVLKLKLELTGTRNGTRNGTGTGTGTGNSEGAKMCRKKRTAATGFHLPICKRNGHTHARENPWFPPPPPAVSFKPSHLHFFSSYPTLNAIIPFI